MKIIVEVDVQQPLLRGTLVKLEGVNTWVNLNMSDVRIFVITVG